MASDGTAGTAWSEYDIQHVVTGVDTDHTSFNDGQEVMNDFHGGIDPLGGLGRDEIAELVAMMVVGTFYIDDQNSPAGRTVGEIHTEFSFDSVEQSMPILGTEVTEADDPLTGLDRRLVDVVDFDILDYGTYQASGVWEDNTNGDSGPAVAARDRYTVPYRGWFGQGPVVDRHDDLHVHLAFQLTGNTDVSMRFWEKRTLIWDVRER